MFTLSEVKLKNLKEMAEQKTVMWSKDTLNPEETNFDAAIQCLGL